MSKVTVLPGMTDTVKVPAFANLIDKVVEFTCVFKRPMSKKETKQIGEFFKGTAEKVFKAHSEYEKKVKKAKTDAQKQQLKDDLDQTIAKFAEDSEAHTRKYFLGFEDLKDADDNEIECTDALIETMLNAPGYDSAIGRAMNYMWTGRKTEEYELGN